jgi:hypothetical protein
MAKAKKAKTKKESSGSFLESKAFKSFMAKLYGWGAAVVIVGALFKIQHWPGAGAMLTLGLSTEALIFFISAFDKQKEYLWEKVYPELITDDEKKAVKEERKRKVFLTKSIKCLRKLKLNPKWLTNWEMVCLNYLKQLQDLKIFLMPHWQQENMQQTSGKLLQALVGLTMLQKKLQMQ